MEREDIIRIKRALRDLTKIASFLLTESPVHVFSDLKIPGSIPKKTKKFFFREAQKNEEAKGLLAIKIKKYIDIISNPIKEEEEGVAGGDIDEIFDRLFAREINREEAKKMILDKMMVLSLKNDQKSALNASVSAVYFSDSSDYLSYHKEVIKSLTGLNEISYEDVRRLYDELNPEYKNAL
jgi:hypothetical protein